MLCASDSNSSSCEPKHGSARMLRNIGMITLQISMMMLVGQTGLVAGHTDRGSTASSRFLQLANRAKAVFLADNAANRKIESRTNHMRKERKLERMTQEQLREARRQIQLNNREEIKQTRIELENHKQNHRKTSWIWPFGEAKRYWYFGPNYDQYFTTMADTSEEYDTSQQAYRMLGGYIDCDRVKKDEREREEEREEDRGSSGCSRWMMWAAYVNPNYDGDEDDLDCHSSDSEWQLLGVYRQEFYQFFEQISKHKWAIDSEEYITALAGLSYMTDEACTSMGDGLYAGVQPLEGGYFQMSMYQDEYCTKVDTSGVTYDDYGKTTNLDLNCDDDGGCGVFSESSGYTYTNDDFYNRRKLDGDDAAASYYAAADDAAGDDAAGDDAAADDAAADDAAGDDAAGDDAAGDDAAGDDAAGDDAAGDDAAGDDATGDDGSSYNEQGASIDDAWDIWEAAQEYTLTNMNSIYDSYKSCTPCMDSPTYQDGFFIGDSGTDDGVLINQCWKFHSHDSFACGADCVSLGNSQGTIGSIEYTGTDYFYGDTYDESDGYFETAAEQRAALLRSEQHATLFLNLGALLFVSALVVYIYKSGCKASLCGDIMEHPCEPCSNNEIVYEEPESENEKEREAWYNTDYYPGKRGRTKARNWGRTRSPSPSKNSASGTDSDNSVNDKKEALIQTRSLVIEQPSNSSDENSAYVPPPEDNYTAKSINNVDSTTPVVTAVDINVDAQSHTQLDTGVENNVDEVSGTGSSYVYNPTPDRSNENPSSDMYAREVSNGNFDSDAARKTLEKTLKEMDISSYGGSAGGKYDFSEAPNSQF